MLNKKYYSLFFIILICYFFNNNIALASQDLLPAPGPILVLPSSIDLDFGLPCSNKQYRLERSFDKVNWVYIVTFKLAKVDRDPQLQQCENDHIDNKTIIPKDVTKVYYRYFEIKAGKKIRASEIGKIDMKQWPEYWDNN